MRIINLGLLGPVGCPVQSVRVPVTHRRSYPAQDVGLVTGEDSGQDTAYGGDRPSASSVTYRSTSTSSPR